MTTYLVQYPSNPKVDLSLADRYGEILPVNHTSLNVSSTPGQALQNLRTALRNFNPEDDYLLWAGGDPMAIFLAGIAIGELGIEEFQVLVYNRIRDEDRNIIGGKYVPTRIRTKQRVFEGTDRTH